MKREDLLEWALDRAMEILTKVVDSEEYPAAIRYDAQQLLRRWQRGEFHRKADDPNIPKDKNHPGNVGQCDDCGGHGCATCNQKGWLLSDHPKVRKCARSACGNIIAPAWIPVYCSNQCAMMDA